MSAILESDVLLLPLESFLHSHKVHPPKPKPVLLSKFKSIDYNTLDKLEMSRIYDTSDLSQITDEQLQMIGFSQPECKSLREEISKEINHFSNLPQLILDLPENHALIFYKIIEDKILFELFWKGLVFWWNIDLDYIDDFMVTFLNLLQELGLPELISFTGLLPELDTVELPIFDISIYITNFNQSASSTIMLELLQCPAPKDEFQCVETFILAYLIKLVQ